MQKLGVRGTLHGFESCVTSFRSQPLVIVLRDDFAKLFGGVAACPAMATTGARRSSGRARAHPPKSPPPSEAEEVVRDLCRSRQELKKGRPAIISQNLMVTRQIFGVYDCVLE